MRIVQVIDSLDIGGAEKMAVNYANSLGNKVQFSGLVTTRKEGDLKGQLNPEVSFLCLYRKKTIDINAIVQFRNYCKENKVTHLQPHSSSYFTAVLLKLLYFKVQIIWHDHNGLSEFLDSRKSLALKLASYFFKGIITVNYQLKNWAINELNCKHVIYLPNYTTIDSSIKSTTVLNGVDGKRILCLANLRIQKNHFLLIDVATKLKETHPDWSFHLVGKDFNDSYSRSIKDLIMQNKLQNQVFIYGSKEDTASIIKQATVCIFTSSSEGLPVALLEFGLLKKPVVATSVGEIPLIIENGENGYVVKRDDTEGFARSLVKLIENDSTRMDFGNNLYATVLSKNSKEAVIDQYLNFINSI